MVSITVRRTLENLPYFLAEARLDSIRRTLSARHSAYIGRVHSQFLGDSIVESAEKGNEMRRSISRLVAIHGVLSGLMIK
jgi:hypothetical protein